MKFSKNHGILALQPPVKMEKDGLGEQKNMGFWTVAQILHVLVVLTKMYEPDQDKKMNRNRQPDQPKLCRVLILPEHELDVQVKDGPAVNGDNLEETLHSDASANAMAVSLVVVNAPSETPIL